MTYLEIVNNVLRRLREDTVDTVNQTTYSALIGVLVNDAKRVVESAADWTALRTAFPINTVVGTATYSLTDCGHGVKVLDAYNVTNQSAMLYRTDAWYRNQTLIGANSTGSPIYFCLNAIDSNGDTQVSLYPTPDAVESVNLKVVKRQADLDGDGDTPTIPHLPIISLATAMAIAERGESGGMSAAEYFKTADSHLADAIALDLNKHPEDLIFMAV